MPKANPGAKGAVVTRRHILRGAAAGGLLAGTEAITGFPTVWAQEVKDVTLVHVGGSYSAIKEIGEQASKDLGFKVVMQAVDPDTQLNRSLTQQKTIDINDMPTTTVAYLLGKGVLQPVLVSKYKWWDQTVPLFTKGTYPDGRPASA
jgi:putative spermidine/putrescine transport system substrate-binding protein